MGRTGWWWSGSVVAFLLAACTSRVERDIEKLVRGGEEAEPAKMALSLARTDAIEPLIEAFQDTRHTPRARVQIADALFRLYIREKDNRILETLGGGLDDGEAEVRRSIVRILGDLRGERGAEMLVGHLGRERHDGVRLEILMALGVMSIARQTRGVPQERLWDTQGMGPAGRQAFVDLLVRMRQEVVPDSLRQQVLEWLEAVAEEKVVEARTRLLSADVSGAEALLKEAVDLVPDSRNANQHLGKFYVESGQRDRGLRILLDNGSALEVRRLPQAPVIDGVLDDSAWRGVEPVTRFYQNIARLRTYPFAGRTEAYVGHRSGTLYIGVQGYEPSTDSLKADARSRDDNTWQDDCVELFFDPDHHGRTYYQVVINSVGTIFDQFTNGSAPQDRGWNGEFEHAVRVQPTYWTLEVAVPMAQFGKGEVGPGAVWGANIARVRIAAESPYGQWVPTYGFSLRPDRFGYLVFE